MDRLLPNPMIQRLFRAAVSARLQRDVLIASIDPRLAGTISRAPSEAAQILTDLLRLNEIARIADGSVPLKDWLENAELLAGPLPEAAVFREALAQLQQAVGTSIAPPRSDPPAPDTRSREAALHRLLLDLFSADELRRFIRYRPGGGEMIAALPGQMTSLAELAHAVVDLLVRRSEVDAGFFAAIEAERPRRHGDIDAVRRLFKV